MTVRRATMSGISAITSVVDYVSLPSNVRPLDFYLWTFARNASALVIPRLLKSKKKHQCQQTRLPLSQISEKAIEDAEERLSAGGGPV